MTATPYVLASELHGHEMDVRALAADPARADIFYSASRDKSVREWRLVDDDNGKRTWAPSNVYRAHSHFVNALTWIPASGEYPNGLIASGSMDKTIMLWRPDHSDAPELTLIGHSDTVSALSYVEATGHLLSASWDKTARVWMGAQCVQTLAGHTQAVWAVVGYKGSEHSDETIITASADRTIKLWRAGKCVRTISTGHTDVVRGLVLLPGGSGFASCANDGTLRLWSLDGEPLAEMCGHTSFVYSVDCVAGGSGELVSGGEDKTVRVWKDGQCMQTILIPATSVWAVKVLANGDIVCGANDGVVRVFTRDPLRAASAEVTRIFDEAVAKASIPANTVGDLDKSKLAGIEALALPGAKDQEVKMVRNGTTIEAHQWSAIGQSWTKLGEVVDAVGSSRKQVYNGREYDYVFDVDIAEGAPPLKLPYNTTDNPYLAAQQFIQRNELPQDYLDQVANFIMSNTKGESLGASSAANADPFTGANRYVPGTTSASSGSAYANPDPFTGTLASADAATGVNTKVIPINEDGYLSFKAGNVAGIQKKVLELNGEMAENSKLTSVEMKSFEKVSQYLQNPAAPAANLTTHEWAVVNKMLDWPIAQRFPALDILRLTVGHSTVPLESFADTTLFIDELLQWSGMTAVENDAPDAAVMLGLRTIANCFSLKEYRSAVLLARAKIVTAMDQFKKSTNKNIVLAYVTVLLNFTTAEIWVYQDEIFSMDLLSALIDFVKADTDPENLYRAVVGIGNLLFKFSSLREAAPLLGASEVRSKCSSMGDLRLRHLITEIDELLAKGHS